MSPNRNLLSRIDLNMRKQPADEGSYGFLRRRDFLRILAGTAAFSHVPQLALASDQPSYPFSEVPASIAGLAISSRRLGLCGTLSIATIAMALSPT